MNVNLRAFATGYLGLLLAILGIEGVLLVAGITLDPIQAIVFPVIPALPATMLTAGAFALKGYSTAQ